MQVALNKNVSQMHKNEKKVLLEASIQYLRDKPKSVKIQPRGYKRLQQMAVASHLKKTKKKTSMMD